MAVRFNQSSAAFICKAFGATGYNVALRESANNDDEEAMRICRALGATNFNEALMVAIVQGHVNAVRLCIEWGADRYFEAVSLAAEHWDRENYDYLFNVFNDLGKSCLLITSIYKGERIKVLFRVEISADQVTSLIGLIVNSWGVMVQKIKDSKPLNFSGSPKITIAYNNSHIVNLSLQDEAEDVESLLHQALVVNPPE